MNKLLFLIIDGAADEGTNTPLMAAKMPNLELLARNSLCGLWDGPKPPAGYNIRSLSELGTMQLLGYSADETPGRGYLEALGLGLKPDKRAVYLRANFATVGRKLEIIDRRAGRDERGLDALAKLLNMKINDVQIKFYRGPEHRGVLVLKPLKGKLSQNVSDSDTKAGMQKILPLKPDTAAQRTADILNEFSIEAHKRLAESKINSMRKLPANYILLRGASQYRIIEQFSKRWNIKACSIAASNIIKGISRFLGIKLVDFNHLSDSADDMRAKLKSAVNALNAYDFVLLHVKGTDTASHAKDPKLKRLLLERIDKEIISEFLHMRNINIVIATDHGTSSKTGEHIYEPVPFLLYGHGIQSNNISRFDEKNCASGLRVENPMQKLLLEMRHSCCRID